MKKYLVYLVALWLVAMFSRAYALKSTDTAEELNRCATDESASALPADYTLLLEVAKARRKPVRDFQARIDIGDSPAVGARTSAVVLIEFGDLQCRYCRRHFTTVFPTILQLHAKGSAGADKTAVR